MHSGTVQRLELLMADHSGLPSSSRGPSILERLETLSHEVVRLGSRLAEMAESSGGSSGAVVGVLENFRAEFEMVHTDVVLLTGALLNQPQPGVVGQAPEGSMCRSRRGLKVPEMIWRTSS